MSKPAWLTADQDLETLWGKAVGFGIEADMLTSLQATRAFVAAKESSTGWNRSNFFKFIPPSNCCIRIFLL
jgi:hypothetical protein